MSDEIQARYDFIDSKLRPDATLTTLGNMGIYPVRGPDLGPYPFIAHHAVSGEDEMVVGDERLWQSGLHDVEIIGAKDADYDDISPIVQRVDFLLHRSSGTVGTGRVERCYRRRVFDIPYDLESGLYPRRILRFEFIVQ